MKPIRTDKIMDGYRSLGMVLLNRAPLAFLSDADRVFIAGELDLVKYLPPSIPLSKVLGSL